MSVTIEDVLLRIDLDEIDYPAAAAELGPDALAALEQLVRGGDPMLASKAAYLASLIGSPGIVERAARHPDARVRIAAAAGLRNLSERDAEAHMEKLLRDGDVGVRKVALESAAAFDSPGMAARLEQLAEHDPEPSLRDLAKRSGYG